MIKTITIQACSTTFCVNKQNVESLYKDGRSARSFLSELKNSEPRLFPLSRLIGRKDNGSNNKKLIVLKNEESPVGLLVDNIGATVELEEESILSLPAAFSQECFDYFPKIAVIEGTAVPLLTPECINRLIATDSHTR